MLPVYEAEMILARVAQANPSPETLRLWAQLVGYPPCPKCDYCIHNCKCPKPGDQLEFRFYRDE